MKTKLILLFLCWIICAADSLRLDSSSADDIEKLAINELFEVILSIQYSSLHI